MALRRLLVASLSALTVTGGSALAIEPDAPERLITFEQTIAFDVRNRLIESDAVTTETAEALKALYLERDDQPLWVDEEGLTERGRTVLDELGRADDWGLDVTKLDLEAITELAGLRAPAREQLADLEHRLNLAVTTYALHAEGGRFDPSQLGEKVWDVVPEFSEPADILTAIASVDDPDDYLRDLHPKHDPFRKLLKAYLRLKNGGRKKSDITVPKGPTLREGDRHAHVAILRQRLDLDVAETHHGLTAEAVLFDEELDEAVRKFQKARGLKVDGIVGNGTRRAMNGSGGRNKVERVLVNLERWRWMPKDLGQTYVNANVPEFRVRVHHKGKVAFNERMVVGKVSNKTPIFNEEMEEINFHPYWNVPNSIKVKEILPSLRRSTRILRSQNLRIKLNGRQIDPGSVDWDSVDVRRFHFYQPPGGPNVLGFVKFMFPNKHSVYMHDTTSRSLFNRSVRTYSHGCMRVQNPRRYAEVLLGIDKGWSKRRIGGIIASGVNTPVHLGRKIPVYVTYFTAKVTDDGKLAFFGDYYGHDRRTALGLSGKALPVPAAISDNGTSRRRTRVANRDANSGLRHDAFRSSNR